MNTHNRINYIEFEAPDLQAIKEFYSKTFGWVFTDYGPDYAAFNDGSLDGGFSKGNKKSATGYPLVILFSTDLEASLNAVKSNGGEIVRTIFEFPGGRRFHFTDPAGNELAVWGEIK